MSVIRAFLVFVPTAAITVLLGTPFTVQQALAKPISVPSSPRVFGGLANFAAGRPGTDSDRSPSPRHLFSHATVALIKSPRLPSRILTRHVERKAARSGPPALLERVPTCASTPRNLNVSSDKIALLQIYYLQALQCAESYRTSVEGVVRGCYSWFSHRKPGLTSNVCVRCEPSLPAACIIRAFWIQHEFQRLHYCFSGAWH